MGPHRLFGLITIAFLLAIAAGVPGAFAACPANNTIISSPGTYTMEPSDVCYYSSGSEVYKIESSNVIIDCQGGKLVGAFGNSRGIESEWGTDTTMQYNLTIRDCHFQNFTIGVYVAWGKNLSVENCTFEEIYNYDFWFDRYMETYSYNNRHIAPLSGASTHACYKDIYYGNLKIYNAQGTCGLYAVSVDGYYEIWNSNLTMIESNPYLFEMNGGRIDIYNSTFNTYSLDTADPSEYNDEVRIYDLVETNVKSNGANIQNAIIEIFDNQGRFLITGKTDSEGNSALYALQDRWTFVYSGYYTNNASIFYFKPYLVRMTRPGYETKEAYAYSDVNITTDSVCGDDICLPEEIGVCEADCPAAEDGAWATTGNIISGLLRLAPFLFVVVVLIGVIGAFFKFRD